MHSSAKRLRRFDWKVHVTTVDNPSGCTFFVAKRPHFDQFLRAVSRWYEVVVFTASLRHYAVCTPHVPHDRSELVLFASSLQRCPYVLKQRCPYVMYQSPQTLDRCPPRRAPNPKPQIPPPQPWIPLSPGSRDRPPFSQDPVIDLLDPGGLVCRRFFRGACVEKQGNFVKDLRAVRSDLSQVVIVDNTPSAYRLRLPYSPQKQILMISMVVGGFIELLFRDVFAPDCFAVH